MNKTAVEYLIEQLEFALPDIEWSNYRNEIDRAKEMEKQQIINAWIVADNELQRTEAEKYYNLSYKKD
jgi:hypothetical protein